MRMYWNHDRHYNTKEKVRGITTPPPRLKSKLLHLFRFIRAQPVAISVAIFMGLLLISLWADYPKPWKHKLRLRHSRTPIFALTFQTQTRILSCCEPHIVMLKPHLSVCMCVFVWIWFRADECQSKWNIDRVLCNVEHAICRTD